MLEHMYEGRGDHPHLDAMHDDATEYSPFLPLGCWARMDFEHCLLISPRTRGVIVHTPGAVMGDILGSEVVGITFFEIGQEIACDGAVDD